MSTSPATNAAPQASGVTGAILAGGESRRLGRDKATLVLGGQPLARWVASALAPAVAELWLVTNHPEKHLSLNLPLITDLTPFQGPLGGLGAALFYARTPWVLLTTADAPFLSPRLAGALAAAAGKTTRPALVCRSARGLEPFPGLYAVRLLPRLQDFLKVKRTFMAFLDPLRPQVWGPEVWRTHDPEGASFENLTRPEDLARFQALVVQRPGAEKR